MKLLSSEPSEPEHAAKHPSLSFSRPGDKGQPSTMAGAPPTGPGDMDLLPERLSLVSDSPEQVPFTGTCR